MGIRGFASPPTPDPFTKGFVWRERPAPVFKVGESIRYVIRYGLISAGTARLSVTGTEDVGDGRPT